MASTDISTSSSAITAPEDHKRTVDDAFLNKLKVLVERLRLENATLKKSLDVERSEVRAVKAQHEGFVRNLKTEHKKREEFLEKQLRVNTKAEKAEEQPGHKLIELKKLTTEIQSLKAVNKGLQEKLKMAQAAECARAAELRAQAVKYAALENAAHKDARAQCHKLLEEIKSKERVIIQLRREAARTAATAQYDQAQRMECGATELSRKLRIDQSKEKSNREDLKTDIQHRKETFYREPPSDEDSAVSSAPASLSPQPQNDMWSCGQCRASSERAEAAARECARLTDALRDARDQLELMEFRLLELEDATPDKGTRDNLTDSDSGCVSPGSRIKDSASPELKRMDSGYKSPHTPGSPCNPRRTLDTPHDDFKEDFLKAQVLADILGRTSESSDSLRSNPVKEHLEQMILNAASPEDRSCLETVLMLLYNLQTLSSSVSEDECYQSKPKKICDLKQKPETDIPSHKAQKAIATVTPYQQNDKCESLESFCSDDRKPSSVLQESGIFEAVETETRSTQTDVSESFEGTELNTEIQRLNSIREKLERQGVRNRTLNNKEDNEGLECRCVKLGKKHKQYYERRLKFLEGKISIYEAPQDVKEAKLAERLQKEFQLENRIQELESQLTELQEKYERLEEDCCELEEIENDTRLHWQQLEMDYELCSAQLRDMTEQRECSRAQAESLMAEINKRECALKAREMELTMRLNKLESAVPALIAFNVVKAVGANISPKSLYALECRIKPLPADTKQMIEELKHTAQFSADPEYGTVAQQMAIGPEGPNVFQLEKKIQSLVEQRRKADCNFESMKSTLQKKIKELEQELEMTRNQLTAACCCASAKRDKLEEQIVELEEKVKEEKECIQNPMDNHTAAKLKSMQRAEAELKARISEMEKREAAYLEMLTQADDMWAEMEGGYKKKIEEANTVQSGLRNKVKKLEYDKTNLLNMIEPIKKKMRELEESESFSRISCEKAQRDANTLKIQNESLAQMLEKTQNECAKTEQQLKMLDQNFKSEIEKLHKLNREAMDEKEDYRRNEVLNRDRYRNEMERMKKELTKISKLAGESECTNSELKEEVESLEKQLSLTQKALSQCKKKCDEKIKTLSHELSIKTEELEELRSEMMRQTYHSSRVELKPDRTEYVDEGYSIYTAVPKKTDYGRMHHSMSYITSESGCSCPSMRSQLVSQLIEDLFDRIHNTVDDDLTRLCKEITPVKGKDISGETKAKIMNYLLMAISKELVRSIGDADAKTDTEEWQRAVSSMTYTNYGEARGDFASLRLAGNAGVLNGAARLASVSCACAAARLCAAVPEIADGVKSCQEEVLDHGDVKIMEEQLANAIESIVNCPSCALGTNAIVWSTDV